MYFHLRDSFGGSVTICLKEVLFGRFELPMVQELKGNGSKDTGWLEKQRKCVCCSICFIHLVVLSVFVSKKWGFFVWI